MHLLDEIIGEIVTISLTDHNDTGPTLHDACVTDVADGWIAYEINGHMNYTRLTEIETITVKGTIN